MTRNPTTLRSLAAALALLCSFYAQGANVCGHSDSPVNPQAAAPGIGGTGDTALRPGIGGTGDVAVKPGIGGTGIDNGGIGGTGIVGVITGFASICVNGVEVHYDDSTPVNDNGQAVKTGVLAVGQVVVVNARGQGDELQAQKIALQHLVVGPIERVDTARNEIRVLGQTLRWSGANSELTVLQPGQWVRVSGLRMSDGSIDTTHMQTIQPQALAQLTGPAEHGPEGGLQIGGATVQTTRLGFMDGMRAWRAAANHQELQVQGTWDGRQLVATGLQLQPTRATLGAVERVVVEGYVKAATADGLDIGKGRMALGAQVNARQRADLRQDREQRVRITGVLGSDDRITVERIDIRQSAEKRIRSSGKSERGSRSGKSDDASGEDDSSSSNSGKTESGDDSKSGSSGNSGSGSGSGSGKSESTSGGSGKSESSGSSGSLGSSGSSGGSGSSGSSGGSGSSGSSGGRSKGK
ncbi:Domain of unknown function DUF5666 [Comamonadaceae bacterium]